MLASKENTTQNDHLLHYQLGKSLGEGGFGHVYQAWDTKLHRKVAIKCLKNIALGVDLIKEARLAASLQHAAFVKVHSLEQTEDSQAIVMELVPGQTLRQLLINNPPNISQVIDIVLQVALAMHEAHIAGLVHGDLKPSNLMQEPSGIVRILDFGLSIQAGHDVTTSIVQADPQGTIAYMAPEVFTGTSLKQTSDIYALGVILYELLTGTRPFSNLSGIALAAAVIQSNSDQWPWPEHLPPILHQLVRAMTDRQIYRRIGSMKEVAERCTQIASIDEPSLKSGAISLNSLKMASAPLPIIFKEQLNWRQQFRKWRFVLLILFSISVFTTFLFVKPYFELMQESIEPYSESKVMKQGFNALSNFDHFNSLVLAEKKFKDVLSHSPQNAAASASLSLVYCYRFVNDNQNAEWLRKAEKAAQSAIENNDFLALSHTAKAKLLGLQERFETAFVEIDRALDLDPNNTLALSIKIDLLIKVKRFEDALSLTQLTFKKYPNERLFADQIGQIKLLNSQFQDAEKAYLMSIDIKQDSVLSYLGLSNALYNQNRFNESVQALEAGLKVKPDVELFLALGNILITQGDFVKAASAYENAVSETAGNPNDYFAWAKLGMAVSWLSGKSNDAKIAYEKAYQLLLPKLKENPNSALLNSRLGLYLAKINKNEEVLMYIQKSLKIDPNNAEIQFIASICYEMLGNRSLAIRSIVKAKELGYSSKLIDNAPELVNLRRDPLYIK